MVTTRTSQDCGVVALANAMNSSYEDAWNFLAPSINNPYGRTKTAAYVNLLSPLFPYMIKAKRGRWRIPRVTGIMRVYYRSKQKGHVVYISNGTVYEYSGVTYSIENYRRMWHVDWIITDSEVRT